VKNGKPGIAMVHAVLIALAGLAAGSASADDSSSRWSLGMQIGQARGTDKPIELAPSEEPSTLSYDMAASVGGVNRFGWRVFTGYRLTNFLAVHVGYTDLGEARSRLVDESLATERVPTFEQVAVQTVRGFDLGLQVKLPVTDRIDVDVRGGKYYWQSRTRAVQEWGEYQREPYRSSDRDSDNFLGAGLEVAVINDLSATLGWTRYKVANEPIELWTVGALYRFGIY
jgi:hypothetical protein